MNEAALTTRVHSPSSTRAIYARTALSMNPTRLCLVICAGAAICCQTAAMPALPPTPPTSTDTPKAADRSPEPNAAPSQSTAPSPAESLSDEARFDAAKVLAFVDGRYAQTAAMAQQLWKWAELGYQETKSSKLLQTALAKEGFSVEANVAEIPTAFVASYGQGRPIIA
ncbi:MAG: hypothetical protein AAFV29_15095, partial [Myxococcota bacterium]